MKLFRQINRLIKRFCYCPIRDYEISWDKERILLTDSRQIVSIPFDSISRIGLKTTNANLFSDDCFLVIFHKDSIKGELWREFSLSHNGVLSLYREIKFRFNLANRHMGLANCVHPASVYLWPPDKAGLPIWPNYGPASSVGTKQDFRLWLKAHNLSTGEK